MSKKALLEFTSGIYCPKGRFYIDPWIPVNKAVIRHNRRLSKLITA